MSSLLQEALHCRNRERPPVWLMRQAGRYLPEYQELRQKYRLWDLFHSPELAAQVTHMPIKTLGVDAAILFSDILVIAEVFGLLVHFPEKGGPQVEPVVAKKQLVKVSDVEESLSYVSKTIRLLKSELKVPLIGFCGGPFTVARYLTRENSELSLCPELLAPLTDASIAYLQMQIKAGVEAVQIFDSWANLLTDDAFVSYSQKYLKKMVDALRPTNVPVILFCRGSSRRAQELSILKPHAISLDWEKPLLEVRKTIPKNIAVQGNFSPDLLTSSPSQIQKEVKNLLKEMSGDLGYIVNLGHGVQPNTPVDNVRSFVNAVKEF